MSKDKKYIYIRALAVMGESCKITIQMIRQNTMRNK